jgi:hypothetical protein
MMNTLRCRLDEFVRAHAEYTLSRERDNKFSDELITARFTFRGECSIVLRRHGNVDLFRRSAHRVGGELQNVLGIDMA